MKSYKMIGLVAVVLGLSVLPSTAWNGGGRGNTGGRGGPVATASSITVGSGVGSLTVNRVAFRDNFNRGNGVVRSNFGGGFGRQGGNRCRFNGGNGGVTVVYPDNGFYGNYNNSNYLGLPPWYRLNYYTPWASDYENGTAYQNIPTSHASLGYGVPEDYPGATSYTGPSYRTAAPMGAPGAAPADVDFVVGVQRELRRRGFYRGVVNGISDAATRSAIRAYEASAGLPVSGVIGAPLLKALGFF